MFAFQKQVLFSDSDTCYFQPNKWEMIHAFASATEYWTRVGVIFFRVLALESRKEAYCQTTGLSLSDLQPANEHVWVTKKGTLVV